MAPKIHLALLAFAVSVGLSTAIAKPPPGTTTYVPPQSTEQPGSSQAGSSGGQGQNGQNGVAAPDSTGGKPPAASDPQRRLSIQQRRAMRACIANCVAAGMTGPFCSHSCIPD